MKPVRVLHVVTVMNFAGIETLLMNFYRKIDREKVQFDFLVHTPKKGDYDDEIYSLGGRIYSINKLNVFNTTKYEKEVYDFLVNHKEYNIVHSHLNTFSKHVLKAAKKANIKHKIAHSHISFPGISLKTGMKAISKININKYADFKFACSKDASNWVFGYAKDIQILKNAIDSEKFIFNEKVRQRVRTKLNIPQGFLVIGNIGRFNHQKNHSFILDVFNQLHKKNSKAILLLAGEGELKKDIEEKIQTKGLADSVRILSAQSNVSELLQAMDIFLFPSRFEGLGIVAIEAQAAGLKTIASSAVPMETNITNLIEYISLKESTSFWAERINTQNNNYVRTNEVEQLRKSGYDISESSQWLEDFYLDLR
jgi:glycosyltransferase involved in cell wall biosynthesis